MELPKAVTRSVAAFSSRLTAKLGLPPTGWHTVVPITRPLRVPRTRGPSLPGGVPNDAPSREAKDPAASRDRPQGAPNKTRP